MLTLLRFLPNINGAGWILSGFLLCTVLFFAACLSRRANRTKKGRKRLLLSLPGAEILCDLLWTLGFFPNGSYCNPGLGGAHFLLLWPALLLAAALLVTARNATH